MDRPKVRLLRSASVALLLAACGPPAGAPPPPASPALSSVRAEVLWDTWGVPHVYAGTVEALGYGFGWAQMESHGPAILRLYGFARGRAAEFWGASYLESDRLVHALGTPGWGEKALARQSSAFRRYVEAFAAGMNAWAEANPGAVPPELAPVLPVEPADVFRHVHRVMFTFLSGTGNAAPLVDLGGAPVGAPPGSNTWAIGPSRSATGNALLLQNPHLSWVAPLMRFYEAQLVGPGMDVYGATLIGIPVIAIGFNQRLGWSHTVNTIDALDTYRLRLADGGYRFDGEIREFTERTVEVGVRDAGGAVTRDTIVVRRSIHGPVVRGDDSTALAVRAPSGVADVLLEWWEMGQARSLEEFETALRRLALPMFNVSYADADGHILLVFNGRVPERPYGDFDMWQRSVRGDTSATLWADVLGYDELPRVLDPPSGFVQNSNSPPWWTTWPPLDPAAYPPYLAPTWLGLREARGLELLLDADTVTLEHLVRMRYSNRMLLADRVLDDLIAAGRAAPSAEARSAAEVLDAWDRNADAGSRGAVLFLFWAQRACRGPIGNACDFAVAFDPGRALETPRGLADPARAAQHLAAASAEVRERFGAPDVAWGEVMRLNDDLAGNGAAGDPLGVFHVVAYAPGDEGFRPVHGDSWVAAIEFTPEGPEGEVLLSYGNATRPGSPHAVDQLSLLAAQQMRPLWRTRAAVEAHLERADTLRRQ